MLQPSSPVMDSQFRRRRTPAAPDGSRTHQIWDQVQPREGMKKKIWLSQYQRLLAMGACILYHTVDRATEGVGPLHLPAGKGSTTECRGLFECSRRAQLQTPSEGEREEKGYHLFLFYLLSSSMWKMIFTVSYLQSWIPCYFIP